MALPTGTVTFWMTDIEGSTRLLRELGPAYPGVLADHHRIVRDAVAAAGGVEVSTEGDAFFCVFRSARAAVDAAVAAQRGLAGHAWPAGHGVRVRMGLHTGEGQLGSTGYVGLDVHRTARVTAAGHGGQVVLTAPIRALMEGCWPDGVDVAFLGAHRLKDLESPELLYQLVVDGLPSRFPPLRSLEAPSYDLPSSSATFVGRSREMADLTRLLDGHRLVTLTGPGGVGKTRLAVRVGAELSSRFPGGVAFVPLAAVRDAALVADEVARALALPVGTYSDAAGLRRLAEQLAGRRMLLILDNVEQLVQGADRIGALLASAPDVTVVATSRAPLRLREEQEYPVAPLDVPTGTGEPLDRLLQHAAAQQFVDRARAARPDFTLAPRDAPYLARILTAVSGLPLAVELVAARVRSLTLEQIADRLDDQLSLLRGGPRDLPERQRALRSTLQWSHDLLPAEAQALLGVLAVFPGGATLEALERVAGPVLRRGDVLDALDPLVEHGLLMRSVDSTNRYRTLQVVREFAAEVLDDGGRADDVWRRHAAWLADLVTAVEPMLLTEKQAEGLDRLRDEYDNLRGVLDWGLHRDPVLAASIAAPLWRYWQMRGQLAEGRRLLDDLLAALPPDTPPATRAALLSAHGGVAYWQRDIRSMSDSYRAAAELYEQLGDTPRLAESLYNRAFPLLQVDGLAEAAALAQRSKELFEQLGDEHGAARARWLRSLAHMHAGELDRAEEVLTAAAATFRRVGDTYHLGWALRMLGRNLILQGRPSQARTVLDDGLRQFAPDDVSAVLLFLADYAAIAGLEGDPERQVRIAGAVDHLRRVTGNDLVDHPLNEMLGLEDSLAALGPRAEQVQAEGAAMDAEQAVRYATGG